MAGKETNMNHGEGAALDAGHLSYVREAPRKSPSHFTEFFLCLVGASGAVLGAALTFTPGLAPELGKVVGRLASFGIEPSSVLITGVTFFALGMLAHVFTKSVALMQPQVQPQHDDSEFMLVADQLATDMAQTLGTLMQISSEIGELSENNRTLLRNMPDPNGQAMANQTPIFRLAASVDQLCANVDTRLANLGQDLSSRLQGVSSSLAMVQSELKVSSQKAEAQAAQPVYAPVAEPEPLMETLVDSLEDSNRLGSEEVLEQAAAPLPHPMGAEPMDLDVRLDCANEQAAVMDSPALDLFDQMEGHSIEEPKPAAPLPSDMAIDPLDDLMPKHTNPPHRSQD